MRVTRHPWRYESYTRRYPTRRLIVITRSGSLTSPGRIIFILPNSSHPSGFQCRQRIESSKKQPNRINLTQYFILQDRAIFLAFHFPSITTKRAPMRKLLVFAAVGLLCLLGCCDSFAEELRDGDIIFQTSQSEQSIAIQKATHSQYSHMGIVFFRNGSPHVYEAINTVQYTPLRKWVDQGLTILQLYCIIFACGLYENMKGH